MNGSRPTRPRRRLAAVLLGLAVGGIAQAQDFAPSITEVQRDPALPEAEHPREWRRAPVTIRLEFAWADARRDRKQNAVRDGNRIEHIVSSGESFWTISRKYGVDMNRLASWNGTSPRDTLSIGQKLVVWTTNPVPGKTAADTSLTRKLNYTVRRGDSLYLIASRFRVTVAQIVRWNNIDKNKILRPGQRLTMYVDVTAQSS